LLQIRLDWRTYPRCSRQARLPAIYAMVEREQLPGVRRIG